MLIVKGHSDKLCKYFLITVFIDLHGACYTSSMNRRELGARLRTYREKAGKSREDAADALNVTVSAIGNYEAGTRGIDVSDAKTLALLYRVTLDELTGIDTNAVGMVCEPSASYDVTFVNDHIEIRLPDDEKLRLFKEAESRGLTLSKFIAQKIKVDP